MQKEYSKNQDFWKWYKEKQEEMKKDETLNFFNEARTTTIHEKPINTGSMTRIKQIFLNSIPKGWGFAITSKGEPIWITPTKEKIHAFEFDNQIERIYLFEKPLQSFLGSNLSDFSVVTLCRLYLGYLSKLFTEVFTIFEGSKQ